ncbi:MAG: biotin--[Clostridia bacterium]|nr:biotin--[acetyl-CoA-carboxylase] ligase [Clostridia bacterium]
MTKRHEIIHYSTVDSTNRVLKELAAAAQDGTVVLADAQTAGRGRLGRSWNSARGEGAYLSVLVKDTRITGGSVSALVFVCALACARALVTLSGAPDIMIKWPNDIVLHGKKLAGILCESGFENGSPVWTVCGIGINLTQDSFPPELPWAASVKSETGRVLTPRDAADAVLGEFDAALETLLTKGSAALLGELKPFSATLGREVRAEGEGISVSGKAIDIAPDGSLIVRTDDGLRTLRAGEVSVRGIMGYI